MSKISYPLTGILLLMLLAACGAKQPQPIIESESVLPGTEVTRQSTTMALLGQGIQVGQRLPKTPLVDAQTMQPVDLSAITGKVLLLSMVPSIDTKVCDIQTHILGEEGDKLPASIKRITISRDTPFAQERFAQAAKLTDLTYLSDYKQGDFGRATGLLVEGPMLLARSIIIVDKQGIVRYIQVVPELTHLPDMEKAFAIAEKLDALP